MAGAAGQTKTPLAHGPEIGSAPRQAFTADLGRDGRSAAPTKGWLMMAWPRLVFALMASAPAFAYAADLKSPPLPSTSGGANLLYDPSRFEIRGGFLASSSGPEAGTPDINGELVFPKFVSVAGWQDILIPRLHVGGMGNLAGRTSYAYAGGLWTVNFGRVFTEVFGGGAIHNGPLLSSDPREASYGCRELYHVGANLGYRFDQNWSAMLTFDHISNGRPTLSNCPANTGLSLLGLRVGYSF
jgi:lipid A 3-O-deacylase